MGQSNYIAAAIAIAFLVFITARGSLAKYLDLLTGMSGKGQDISTAGTAKTQIVDAASIKLATAQDATQMNVASSGGTSASDIPTHDNGNGQGITGSGGSSSPTGSGIASISDFLGVAKTVEAAVNGGPLGVAQAAAGMIGGDASKAVDAFSGIMGAL